MPVRPKIRFEVFKRDDYQCQYCGRRVPEVTLEVDHILAVANGGKDGMDNLLTSCVECNQGKGARPVGETSPRPDYAARLAQMKEREKQVKAYFAHEEELEAIVEGQAYDLLYHWIEELGYANEPNSIRSLRWFLSKTPPRQIRRAMDQAAAKVMSASRDGHDARWRYFCGIMHGMIREGQVS